jgi:hypothetical protein
MRLKEIKNAAHDHQSNSRWVQFHADDSDAKSYRVIGIGRKYVRVIEGGRAHNVTPESIKAVW